MGQDPALDFLKQSYLLTARMVRDAVAEAQGLDPATHAKASFYVQQLIEACSPTNFPLTNPAVLRQAQETRGESLRRGMERLRADLERGRGELAITMSRPDAFRLGCHLPPRLAR